MSKRIIYWSLKGYKYQLCRPHTFWLYDKSWLRLPEIVEAYITLDEGSLAIDKGYCWDGPSGPSFDTLTFMRGSLLHDALYQLMRLGRLDQTFRKTADKELRWLCLDDGMNRFRAAYVYAAVRMFGGKSARPVGFIAKRKLYEAP